MAQKEKLTPAEKPVEGARSGVNDGGHKHLTTPKEANGKYWNYGTTKAPIMK